MSYATTRIAVVVVTLGLSPHPAAQGLVTQRNLSLALAKTIAEATLAECKSKGFNTAAAVVDRAGQVLVILRDEQGTAQMAEMARRKAYTARMFRMPTTEFQKRTATDPSLLPQRDVQDILALGGGMPILAGGEVIGGVAQGRARRQMRVAPRLDWPRSLTI
jgi:uncharacterized protein GlcG (DUF336 family)